LIKSKSPDQERIGAAEEYKERRGDAEKNLRYLIEMAEYYKLKEYHKIIEFQHPVDG
jgi:hypothetical protein